MGQKPEGLEDAVNSCIKMALQGEHLEKDSQEMSDIVSYIESLNDGKQRAGLKQGEGYR